jgi:BlaI family transcriptional regulator, penicillinase repressor
LWSLIKTMKLTKAEEQIMHIIWQLEKCFIKDILEELDDPKPAYTTVATVVKVLEKKGFVAYREYGKAHQFYPLISRTSYSKKHVNPLFKRYFKGSIKEVVSFFAENNKIHTSDIEDAIKALKNLKKKKKQ